MRHIFLTLDETNPAKPMPCVHIHGVEYVMKVGAERPSEGRGAQRSVRFERRVSRRNCYGGMMRLLINANVFGWRMTGFMPKGTGWFFGFSRRPKDIAGEPRLVGYAPDGETCTLNFDGEEHYYARTGTTANVEVSGAEPLLWRSVRSTARLEGKR